jgi:hypothetical protein
MQQHEHACMRPAAAVMLTKLQRLHDRLRPAAETWGKLHNKIERFDWPKDLFIYLFHRHLFVYLLLIHIVIYIVTSIPQAVLPSSSAVPCAAVSVAASVSVAGSGAAVTRVGAAVAAA